MKYIYILTLIDFFNNINDKITASKYFKNY